MKVRSPRYVRARGLSLVELMVALVIGAILLGGAVTLFINNRDTYKTTNELSRLQETARYALDMLVKDIRMAGYFGCADRLDTVTLNVPVDIDGRLWDFNLDPAAGPVVPPIEGLESANQAAGFQPSGFAVTVGADGANGEVIANTDGIAIRYAAGNMADLNPANGTLDTRVTADAVGGIDSDITADSTAGFALNQVAVIGDCGGSDIFQINAAPTATTLRANELSRGYNVGRLPMIAPFVGVRYYIGDNGRGPGGEQYPSLYRTTIAPGTLTESHQELFEGVEQLQILYGVDTGVDGVPDIYVPAGTNPLDAANPGNWTRVVSVRIGLLMRTVDEHGRDVDKKNDYVVNDLVFDPVDDRRRRRVFTTTAMVRNLS